MSGKKIIEPPGERHGLTKADLVDVVYERHGGITRYEAAEIVEAILQTVKTSLRDGRTVRIKNFGTFEVTSRPGRMGINPVSGEKIFIPPHKGLSFRPARRLRNVIRPGRLAGESS
ncbi:MAG TPA: HU family DNA-binding protein [Thermoanaerobaculia bacterium]|nr:HU family DNA-binding protein [Thermoanaerobaculia bacterium]